jgi:diacylglycerol O-acyltransferase / wax synthase
MQRLSGLDAGFLYMETSTLHMHTLKVAVFDPAPGERLTFEEMREAIRTRLPALPAFRRRVVEVPVGFHHPVWIEDPDFDFDQHVRRVELPSPGSSHELEEAIADLAGTPLDRGRPLWELYVFEGLEGDRLAVCVKVHHAVADGVAAAALLANVLSTSSDDDETSADDWSPEPVPSSRELLIDALRDHLRQLRRFPALVGRTISRLRAVARHRRRARVATPLPILNTPRTSFNTALTPRRSFATTSLALDDARRVKAAFGVSLNDVVLAVVAGALRTYLLSRNRRPERPLVAGVPVAADDSGSGSRSDVRLDGNRVSNMFTSLATDEPDTVRRLFDIHDVTDEAKAIQELFGSDLLGEWVQYTPPRPYAWFMRLYSRRRVADHHPPAINLVVSNVPGPRQPLFAAGALLRELYSVGPVLEGIGLNITVWSYLDRLYVSALGCRDTLPDVRSIVGLMPGALTELVDASTDRPVTASER